METSIARALLQITAPRVGNEVRQLVRDLKRLAGVRRVAPSTKIPRLLSVRYDPKVIQARTLVEYVRRSWAGALLV